MKFHSDTGAAVSASLLDIADNRTEQNRRNNDHIAASGDRIPDFGGARLNCTDELNLNRSITGRYTSVRKILASVSQMCNEGNQCLWLNDSGDYNVPQDGAIERALQAEMDRLIQRHGRKTVVLVYQVNGVNNFYLKGHEQSATPFGGQGESNL